MNKHILCKKDGCNIFVEHPEDIKDIKGYKVSFIHHHEIDEKLFENICEQLYEKEKMLNEIAHVIRSNVFGLQDTLSDNNN